MHVVKVNKRVDTDELDTANRKSCLIKIASDTEQMRNTAPSNLRDKLRQFSFQTPLSK